jgi:hypothetical protein
VSARRARPVATADDYDDSDGWYLDDGPIVYSDVTYIVAPDAKGGRK